MMAPVQTPDNDASHSSADGQSSAFWHRPPSCELEQDADAVGKDSQSHGLLSISREEEDAFSGVGGGRLWQQKGLSDGSKRRQAKMLLVALIESFCRVYGESPEANRKVFFLICQTLRSLGLIDAEFMDEMASVRSTFQNAFQQLFYTAVQTVQDERLFQQQQRKMIGPAPWSSSSSSNNTESTQDVSSRRHPTPLSVDMSTSSLASSEQLLFNLSVQNSRYANDFVEVGMLGRGGFASVWRARNKLEGIDYAIKKVRLGKDLDAVDDGNPYEKIFREIKHLARLEHRNVVRYYSSWLELVSTAAFVDDQDDDDEDYFSEYYQSKKSRVRFEQDSSTFNDPIFIFSDESSLRADPQPSSPGIDFAAASEEDEEEGNTTGSNSTLQMSLQRSNKPSTPSSSAITGQHNGSAFGSFDGEWVLYIQMQLCPATLHDFIKFRNQQCFASGGDMDAMVDPQRNIDIFAQILEGAAYMHEQGVIHRDLKPTNIFLSMPSSLSDHSSRRTSQSSSRPRRSRANSVVANGGGSGGGSSFPGIPSLAQHHDHSFSFDSVHTPEGLRQCMWNEPWVPKIGDFGLAAASEEGTQTDPTSPSYVTMDSAFGGSSSSSSSNDSNTGISSQQRRPSMRRMRTGGVGTRTYASPEQLAHRPSAYGEKVDIYSLAIIFFELYRPFATAMERAEAIDALKQSGVFPDGFVERYPKESALILWMMDPNPAHRPTAAQLLDFELFTGDSTDSQQQQQYPYQQEPPHDCSYASLQSQLEAKSQALDQQAEEMAALRMRMERIELEKKREMDAMQKRLDELQRQLEQAQQQRRPSNRSLPLTPPLSDKTC